jgi:type IV pilus assembly protein PilY1
MTSSSPSRFETLRRAATQVLVYLLCVTQAWSVSATSTLVQSPPFTGTEPPGNVFVMLDDSGSMGGHSLPLPSGVTIVGTAGTTVTINGEGANASGIWASRSWAISRDFDWRLRAPALNPLWYNPAIRYLPWNKDGTLLPNASIGGSTETVNWGAFESRANAAQLTERDPRQVPTGGSYTAVSSVAGRGLLGTDLSDPTGNLASGRRVNGTPPTVDFRYHKMPFDFGPTQTGAVTAPRNGHASSTWSTHNDVTSPLDLFSRPVNATAAYTNSGCFANMANCTAGQTPISQVYTETWTRTNCAGTVQTFATNPGPLTCYRSRCGAGPWSGWSTTPPSTNCGFTWVDCFGVTQTSLTWPGEITCGWRRQQCNGTWQTGFPNDPGNLTCYATRGCDGGGWSSFSASNPGVLPACFRRLNCAGSGWDYFSGSDPGTLSCPFSRADCSGTVTSYLSNPGNLSCWDRAACTGGTVTRYATNPGNEACRYERLNCPGTNETFPLGADPGTLTCYSRQNCDGSTTGPTPTVLSSLSCAIGGELPVTYNPTTFNRLSNLIVRTPTPVTLTPSGGATRTSESYARVQTFARVALQPTSIVPVAINRTDQSETRNATVSYPASCPTGTSTMSCTVPAAPVGPDPGALTPARYYRFTGGNAGDPANYQVVQIDRTRPSTFRFPVVDAATGQTFTAADSPRTDCAARTECTWPEEAQNFANWWLYYRNRLFAAQAVMADAMSGMTGATQQQLRLGYGRINYTAGGIDGWRTGTLTPIGALASIDGFANPGALVRGVRPFLVGSAARAAFFDWLFSVAWVGPTPNREAIDSIGRYFSWADNRGPWGATPGTNDSSAQLACRRNWAFLATDGEWTNVAAGQPLISDSGALATPGTPTESDNVAGPTITGDGANAGATFTYAPTSFPPFTGGASQSGTLTDAAVYYWNRDLRPDLPNVIKPVTDSARPNPAFWQSMSTYIVGYGLSASMDTPATRAAVTANTTVTWPTVDLSQTIITGGERVNDNLRAALASRGNFYAARDTGQLKAGILGAFQEILQQQGSAGGIAVTGAGITGSSLAFFPGYTTGSWTGSLRAYSSANLEALAAGNAATAAWTASHPAAASRNVLTATGPSQGAVFQSANLSSAQLTALAATGHSAGEIVAYVRGDDALELLPSGAQGSRKFRARPAGTRLGDFVNSTPLYVKAPDYGFGVMPSVGSSYGAYVSGRRSASTETVYIGGNAGMFHAFDATTGVERWAYVPRGVYPDLPRLADPGYAHRYFVDGPVTGGDWHDGSAWRSVVVGTTGAGGASIFAIDTTSPAAVGASGVMWDLTKADNEHLGHVLTRGVVGRVKTGASSRKWVYIVGNGYESTSNRAALLVIDLDTGAITAIPAGPVWDNTLAGRNGLGGVTVSYDAERNIDAVYAGDRLGNLWRFDFSSSVPTAPRGFDGAATPLFTAVDGSGNRRPIAAAPRLAMHPRGGVYAVFGTGKLHDEGDAASTATQGIYGIWIKPNHAATITTSQVQTLSMTTAGDGTRSFELGGIDWGTKLGWQVPLTGGERVISDPSAEFGMVSISSFTPGAGGDACAGGGTSFMYRIDYSNGRAIAIPVPGVVGAITPLVSMPNHVRNKSSVNLGSALTGPGGGGGGGGQTSQCRLYSTSIQGRPNVIAQNCPGLAPMRVWRPLAR